MGGRGTFAAGNPVPYTYEVDTSFSPDGKYKGIKVLKGIEGSGQHGLPESSHSSTAYIKMNPDGTFNMMRVYDKSHNLRLEIGYHVDNKLPGGNGKKLHYHIYDTTFSQSKEGHPNRPPSILHKNSKIYKTYSKYFKGVPK